MKKYTSVASSGLQTTINRVLLVVASSAFMVLVTMALFRCSGHGNIRPSPDAAASPPFDFVPPAPKSLSDCDELFGPDTAAASYQLSSEYRARFPDFEAAVNQSAVGERIEGFTFEQRDAEIASRLRSTNKYKSTVRARTSRYKNSFIPYALSNYQ